MIQLRTIVCCFLDAGCLVTGCGKLPSKGNFVYRVMLFLLLCQGKLLCATGGKPGSAGLFPSESVLVFFPLLFLSISMPRAVKPVYLRDSGLKILASSLSVMTRE